MYDVKPHLRALPQRIGVHHHLGVDLFGVGAPDDARVTVAAPSPMQQLKLLEEQNALPALGEMIRRAASHDARAHHHGVVMRAGGAGWGG